MPRTARTLLLTASTTALALVAGACSDGAITDPTSTDGIRVGEGGGVLAAGGPLTTFDSCDALLAHLQAEATKRVTPYGVTGLASGGGFFGRDGMMDDVAMAEDSAAADASVGGGASPAFSETNNQVAGVDEPDIVKTDGRRIVTMTNGAIHVVDVSGDEPREIASLRTPDEGGGQLLLSGDRLLVVGNRFNQVARPFDDTARFVPQTPSSTIVRVTAYDLTEDAIEEVSQLEVDGTLVSARLVGERLHLVTSAQPGGLDLVVPRDGGLRGEAAALEANRRAIADSEIDDWLPYTRTTDAAGRVREGRAIDCGAIAQPAEFTGFGTLAVVSVDASTDSLDTDDTAGVLGQGQQVYATADRMYVSTTEFIDWASLDSAAIARRSQASTTSIHAFEVGDGAPGWSASGSVPGRTLNQFAFDEFEGDLRVATTTGNDWWGNSADSVSQVSVLRRDGEELQTIGQVGDLGKGEQIRSVRFLGDRAYVVTFRQTDPLYTIDLSEPTAPVTAGELKILGYSAYLHPVGDHLLLGVGQSADEEGRTEGLQLSLFDVSDDTNPERIAQVALANGYSEAEWDHHAFLWWDATKTAVVPLSMYGENETDIFTGAVGFTVGGGAITELGRISHAAEGNPWDGQVQRSLVIGDTLWTLGYQDLRAHDLSTMATTATIDLR